MRDIQPGEQLTISYVELAATRLERRQQLLYQYFFDIDEEPQHQQQQQEKDNHAYRGIQEIGGGCGSRGNSSILDGGVGLEEEAAHYQEQQQQQHQQQQGSTVAGLAWLQAVTSLPGAFAPQSYTLPGGAQVWRFVTTSRANAPPWPMDPLDTQLAQILLGGEPLPGGMQLLEVEKGLQQEELLLPGVGEVEAAGLESMRPALQGEMLSAGAAGGVRPGGSRGMGERGGGPGRMESLEEAEMEGEDLQAWLMGLDVNARQQLMEQQLQRLMGGVGLGGGQQVGQQQQHVVLLQWGGWGPQVGALPNRPGDAAAATGGGGSAGSAEAAATTRCSRGGSTGVAGTSAAAVTAGGGGSKGVETDVCGAAPLPVVVAAAAELLLRVRAELQQAEQLLQQGKPGAAADLLSKTVNLSVQIPAFQAVAVAGAPLTSPVAEGEQTTALATKHAAGGGRDGRRGGDRVKEVRLGPCHVLRLGVLAALMRAAIEAGDRWGVALGAAQALTPIYKLVYPKVRFAKGRRRCRCVL